MSVFWHHYLCTQAQQRVWKDRGQTTVIGRRQNKEVPVSVRRKLQFCKGAVK